MNKFLSLLAALVAFVVLSNGSFAQSASLNGTATIITPITATATAPLAFGTISKGATASVAATNASAAAVTFSGDEGDNITITVPASLTLSTASGAGSTMTVTINRNALRVHSSSAQASAVSLDASSGTASTNLSGDNGGDGVNNDGLGQSYLWIGGSVTPGATQQRGNYSGSFTVSAAYSN